MNAMMRGWGRINDGSEKMETFGDEEDEEEVIYASKYD